MQSKRVSSRLNRALLAILRHAEPQIEQRHAARCVVSQSQLGSSPPIGCCESVHQRHLQTPPLAFLIKQEGSIGVPGLPCRALCAFVFRASCISRPEFVMWSPCVKSIRSRRASRAIATSAHTGAPRCRRHSSVHRRLGSMGVLFDRGRFAYRHRGYSSGPARR